MSNFLSNYAHVADPQMFQDDAWHDAFRHLRQNDPVHLSKGTPIGDYWSVTRYEDIMKVDVDDKTFSSVSDSVLIEENFTGDDFPSFIKMDDPDHAEKRGVVAPIVQWKNIETFEQLIKSRTVEILDNLPVGQTFDWVSSVSVPLTTMMLATLLDYPLDKKENLSYWTEVMACNPGHADSPISTTEQKVEVIHEMADEFKVLLEAKKQSNPDFDLLSLIAHSARGNDISFKEFIGTIALLIVGGNDTTRNSMSGGMLFFDENPEELIKFRQNPKLMKTAIPEIIRYQTPLAYMARTATVDTELNGKLIKAGDRVAMWYVSGNRDESFFDNPDRFQIDRKNARQHLSFGNGVHRCMGARIAESQLRILWETLIEREIEFEVTGPVKRFYSNFVRGIRQLPVKITKKV